jgi:hypothetical protein
MVEVVAAERRVAVRREHFEHAARELEDRDVERAAAEIVDRVRALGAVVEAVSDGRGRRLVEKTQHLEARELRGVLRRLPLRVVEVGRHRDHRARELAAEARLGAHPRNARQDLGGDFDRALDARSRCELHHARLFDEAIGKAPGIGHVREPAAHHSLHETIVLRGSRACIACAA